MTRKHFQAIAGILADLYHEQGGDDMEASQRQAWVRAVSSLASVMAESNELFDQARFFEACGAKIANKG